MSLAGWVELVALAAAIVITAPPLGRYIAHVLEGGPSKLDRVFDPVEHWFYRACRIDPEREQRWNVYAISLDRLQRRRASSSSTGSSACREACRSTRPTSAACRPRWRSTPQSAS